MIQKSALLLITALSLCGPPGHAQTSARRAAPSDADIKTYALMKEYMEWRQLPATALPICKTLDPAGAASREAAHAAWVEKQKAQFELFDGFVDRILPRLAPASGSTSLRPSEFFANATNAKFIIGLSAISQEKKSDACARFTTELLVPLGDPKSVSAATSYLQEIAAAPSQK